jgi:hypothetical protein
VQENVAEVAAEAGADMAANEMPRPPAAKKGTPMSDAHFRTEAPGLPSVGANTVWAEDSRVLMFTNLAFHLRENLHNYRESV